MEHHDLVLANIAAEEFIAGRLSVTEVLTMESFSSITIALLLSRWFDKKLTTDPV